MYNLQGDPTRRNDFSLNLLQKIAVELVQILGYCG